MYTGHESNQGLLRQPPGAFTAVIPLPLWSDRGLSYANFSFSQNTQPKMVLKTTAIVSTTHCGATEEFKTSIS